MSSSPLSLQFPSQSTKIQVRREYREAPTTPLTLRLPLRSLSLNWPNELAIGEALVTAYWSVHACVHARTHTPPRLCEIYCDNKIPSLVVCFFPLSPLCLFVSVQQPLSHSLHQNPISYYTDIDLFLIQIFAYEKKGVKMRGRVRQNRLFIFTARGSD